MFNIGNAIKGAVGMVSSLARASGGAAQILSSAMKLDFKGMAEGVKEMAGAAMDAGKNMLMMHPAAMAVNTLMGGALEKMLSKAQEKAMQAIGGAADGVAGNLTSIKDGAMQPGQGLLGGNMMAIGLGLAGAAMSGGAMQKGQELLGAAMQGGDFTPGGLMRSAAQNVLERQSE